MPNTAYNVSMIFNRVPQYSRAQILQVLDEVQQYVYSKPCSETLYYSGRTGMPPILRTRKGHYKYECPDTCRETASVFSQEYPRYYDESRKGMEQLKRTYYFQGTNYYRVPVISRQATQGANAIIKFPFDPGTTKDVYYHLFYLKPIPLATEDVQLLIPEDLHIHLRRAVLALLSTEDYGETGIDYQVLDKVAKEVRDQLNRGRQARASITRPQSEFMDYVPGGY